MTITFLGTSAVLPGPGHDTASYVIDGRYLIDTGWSAALRMRAYGVDPLALEALFFTHLHHDHYLGLPAVLFARGLARGAVPPLRIVGPEEDLERVVERAVAFLQADRYPEFDRTTLCTLEPVVPGDVIPLAGGALTVQVHAARHTVPARCYRFASASAAVAITGDTAPLGSLVEAVWGVDLLVTEASYGAASAPEGDRWLHQGAPEAVALARAAEVRRLALVHCPEDRQAAALAAARAGFPETFWPADGERVTR